MPCGAPFYARHCRRVGAAFDVRISTYNFCDFAAPTIQCIADFSWDDATRKRLHGERKGNVGRGALHAAYRALCRAVGSDGTGLPPRGRDLVLANSQWSARILMERFGLEAEVLYPPVAALPEVGRPEREPLSFVALGRLAPEKRIEDMVAILRSLRSQWPELTLHVIGRGDGAYADALARLADAEPWIVLHGALYGAEKARRILSSPFAIHACRGEAFGIAVAEMARAGCVTFVPNEGGQVEIVEDARLRYSSLHEAVAKIRHICEYPDLALELSHELRERSDRFSTNAFCAQLREHVVGFRSRGT